MPGERSWIHCLEQSSAQVFVNQIISSCLTNVSIRSDSCAPNVSGSALFAVLMNSRDWSSALCCPDAWKMNFWCAQIRNSLNWTQWLPELGLQGLAPHGNSVGMWKKIQTSDSLCNCNAKLQKMTDWETFSIIILVKTTASRNAGTYMYIILELCIYSIRFYFILFYSTLTGLWWHTPDGSLQNPEACENILGCGSDGSDGKSNPTQLALAGGSWLWKV